MENCKKFLDIGIFNIQDGKYNEGIKNINKAIEVKNDWEIPYFYRGVAFQALEKYDDAILDYTKALSINNKMTDAYYNRARIILTRKDIQNPPYERAILDLEKALQLDDCFIDALYAMAVAKMKVEKYNESLNYLEKLLKIQPDSINAKALRKLLLIKYVK
ncbi:MAG: tetratricopeptide repeat protein [bacterium]|nr:tetratricopeptide repeat protein [bacterium]